MVRAKQKQTKPKQHKQINTEAKQHRSKTTHKTNDGKNSIEPKQHKKSKRL